MWIILFRLCNAPAMFQRLMQNCLGELNLMYCLIYLDDMIVFWRTEEEACAVLVCCVWLLLGTNLKLNPLSVNSSGMRLTIWLSCLSCLNYHVSKEGVRPSKENLKAVAEFAPPKLTWKLEPFWAWWALSVIQQGFACIAQLLHEHLSGEGASKKSE